MDYWLDNLMCQVPEVVMCYHLDGIVQKYELMQTAWRERNPEARIRAAKEAIEKNGECATAYILLAEEEAEDIAEAEAKFREAFRIAEQVRNNIH